MRDEGESIGRCFWFQRVAGGGEGREGHCIEGSLKGL